MTHECFITSVPLRGLQLDCKNAGTSHKPSIFEVIICGPQVYALAFYYGGHLVGWHEASFGDILKVQLEIAPVDVCRSKCLNLLSHTLSVPLPSLITSVLQVFFAIVLAAFGEP